MTRDMPITLFTKSETFSYSSLDNIPLPFERILRVDFGTEEFMLDAGSHESEWPLNVSPNFSKGLLVALQSIKSREPMNCHRFGRIMTGMQNQRFPHDNESHAPSDICEKNKVGALAMGRLGLVGAVEDVKGARHSLVGLGENNQYAIQVMSAKSDIGIARYEDTLRFYRQSLLGERVANLFAAEQ